LRKSHLASSILTAGLALPGTLGLPGCTRFKDDPPIAAPPEASAQDSEPACDATLPFGPPVLVPGLADIDAASVGGLRLSPDSLTGYFHASGRPDSLGGNDLYRATRISPTAAFTDVISLGSAVNSAEDESDPSPRADSLALIFARAPNGPGMPLTLLEAGKVSSQPFSASNPIGGSFVPSITDENPFWATDGTLYFASERSTDYDLYLAAPEGTGFAAPTVLPGSVNSAFNDVAPVVTANGLTLYYASDRVDGGWSGNFDIWMATRSSTSDEFSLPGNVQEINSAQLDVPTFATSDGCTLYFASTRTNVLLMYQATRGSP
jgi:hypothetical protein